MKPLANSPKIDTKTEKPKDVWPAILTANPTMEFSQRTKYWFEQNDGKHIDFEEYHEYARVEATQCLEDQNIALRSTLRGTIHGCVASCDIKLNIPRP